MAKQTIGLGSAPNDGTGDGLRVAGDKVNDNFDELYAAPTPTAITLGGGWSNLGSGLAPAQFYKLPNKLVIVEGIITAGGDGVIATLPAGSRPAASLVFPARCNTGSFRIDVGSDGTIAFNGSSTGFSSLCGISFYAA